MDSRVWKFLGAAAVGLAWLGAQPQMTVAQTAGQGEGADDVLAKLDQLDAWLGDGDNGDRWRAHLRTEQLRGELAKGGEADAAVVGQALEKFRGEAGGLALEPFDSTAQAIDVWLMELIQLDEARLARLAYAARDDHRPITLEEFVALRADLRDAIDQLDRALALQPAEAGGWKAYLLWDQLTPHASDGFQADAQSLDELDDVLLRFRSNQPGLELPAFTDVAKAIVRYRTMANWATTAQQRDSRPDYERYLDAIQRRIERHVERPSMETIRQIARGVGVVDGIGQSPQFVGAVRKAYAQPNLFGVVSANFLTHAPNRNINRVTPVRDCILGTSIFGTAHTVGEVRYELLPSDDSIELAVFLDGTAHSTTRGYNGPVRINTNGTTTYWAHQRISISDDDFLASGLEGDADTHTRIRSIQKTGGQFGAKLIEKIAWKRAGQQKRQAERISSRHTRERVLREFQETVARDLGAARIRYENELRTPLVRRGVSPEYMRMSSHPERLSAEALFATRNQLGAPSGPPPMMAGHDMALQIHESAVNNYLPLALSSARISQETADVPAKLEGNVPNWLKALSLAQPKIAAAASAGVEIVEEAQERIEDAVGVDAEELVEDDEPKGPPPFKPYSITLNDDAPASVRFDNGEIAIRVRAAVLASEEREYRNWDFVIVYRIAPQGDRILLERVGEIEVFPTGFDPEWPTQLTAEQTSFRSVLKKNMNERANAGQSFPKEIPIEPVRLSRFGVLVLRELVADNGWLTAGWGLP